MPAPQNLGRIHSPWNFSLTVPQAPALDGNAKAERRDKTMFLES